MKTLLDELNQSDIDSENGDDEDDNNVDSDQLLEQIRYFVYPFQFLKSHLLAPAAGTRW